MLESNPSADPEAEMGGFPRARPKHLGAKASNSGVWGSAPESPFLLCRPTSFPDSPVPLWSPVSSTTHPSALEEHEHLRPGFRSHTHSL